MKRSHLPLIFLMLWLLLPLAAQAAQFTGEPDDPFYDEQWALELMNAPCVWAFTTGNADVTVAVLDTGVDLTHPDLVDRLRDDGYDFADDDDDPSDDFGHGTHVAGIVAATLDNAEGVVGLAPDVQILPIRVLGANTSIEGFKAAIADGIRHSTERGARVINMSLGGVFSDDIAAAINEAQDAGVLVIISAGNDFLPLPNELASNDPEVLVVAASNEDDELTDFSNSGPWIDLTAPGEHIYSTMPTYEVFMTSDEVPPEERSENDYDFLSGTSMSAPYVAAAAALLFAAHPDWTPEQVTEALQNSAFPGIYDGQPDIYERLQLLGAGRLDPCAALEANPPSGQAAQETEPTTQREPEERDIVTPTTEPADGEPSQESEDQAAVIEVIETFFAAAEQGDTTTISGLIDAGAPNPVDNLSDLLSIQRFVGEAAELEYVPTFAGGSAQVEVIGRFGGDASATLLFMIAETGQGWRITDYDLSGFVGGE